MGRPPSRRRQVVDGGVGAQLRSELLAPALLDEPAHLALRVVEVSEGPGARRAVGDARRLAPLRDPVHAEVALHHDAAGVRRVLRRLVRREALRVVGAGLVVEVSGAVRAGLHAGAAADAEVAGDVHHAVLGVVGGAGGAHLDARGLGAVEAEHREEDDLRARVGAELALDDAGEEDAGRRAVLGLAGELAAVAPHAALEVDHHAVSHGTILSLTQVSRLRLTGLVWAQSISSSSLKKTPLPRASGSVLAQCPAQPPTPTPSGWMASVRCTRPRTRRPAGDSSHTSWPSWRPLRRAVAVFT